MHQRKEGNWKMGRSANVKTMKCGGRKGQKELM